MDSGGGSANGDQVALCCDCGARLTSGFDDRVTCECGAVYR
jgi:hypothetical protein